MAKASELTVGSVWYVWTGRLDTAQSYDLPALEKALAHPVTVIGGKEPRMAQQSGSYGHSRPDAKDDGWLVAIKGDIPLRLDVSRAVRPGAQGASVRNEPERVIKGQWVLRSGRGLYTEAQLREVVERLERQRVADRATVERHREAVADSKAAATAIAEVLGVNGSLVAEGARYGIRRVTISGEALDALLANLGATVAS